MMPKSKNNVVTKLGRRPILNSDEETYAQLRNLSLIQCTKEEAAAVLSVHKATLYRFLAKDEMAAEAWEDGQGSGNVSLRRKQWKLADKSAGMAIFLGKQYLGQKDVSNLQHTGAGGTGPVQVIHSAMTQKEASQAYAQSIEAE